MSLRAWWLGVFCVMVVVLLSPAVAEADERTDAITEGIRGTGVYVTDHAPRAIGPEDIPRLRKMLDRIPVRTFLAVAPNVGVSGKPLAAVLHDRLGQDGLYLVMDESGIYFDGLLFGPGTVPVDDAARASGYELPHDAGPFLRLERFVEIVTSGKDEARERAAKSQARARKDPHYPMSFRDRRERQQWQVEAGSTAAGAIVTMGALYWLRRRRRAARKRRPVGLASAAVLVVIGLGALSPPQADAGSRPSPGLGAGVAAPALPSLGVTAPRPSGGVAAPAVLGADGPVAGRDRIARVVAGLERSPLFVDPDVGHLLPPAERPALEAALREAGVPIYVVAIPQVSDDESDGLGRAFLFTLHDRFARPGVYLVVDDQGQIDDENFDVARNIDIDFDLRSPPNFDQPPAVATRLAAIIETIRQSPPGTPYPPSNYSDIRPLEREHPTPNMPADQLRRSAALGFFVAGPIAGSLLYFFGALLAFAVRSIRADRRAGTATAPGPGGLPLRTPDAPSEPDRRWLRRQAEAELAALNAALDHADFADSAAGRRTAALSSYDAAALLLGGENDDPLSLVAATVLARDGRRALQPSRALLVVPCAVNPLHGPASKRRQVTLLDRPARLTPLCPACVGLAAPTFNHRLLHLDIDGEATPYLSVPGFWPEDPSEATGPTLAARVREYLGVH